MANSPTLTAGSYGQHWCDFQVFPFEMSTASVDCLTGFVSFSFIHKWIYLWLCCSQFLSLHTPLHHPVGRNQRNGAWTPPHLPQWPAVGWPGFPPLPTWGLSRASGATMPQVRGAGTQLCSALLAQGSAHSCAASSPSFIFQKPLA